MIARLPIQTNEMDKTIVIGPLFSTYFLHFSNRLGLGVKKEGWSLSDNCFGSFTTHTAIFLLNDCEGLIFCTIFADDGNDKA